MVEQRRHSTVFDVWRATHQALAGVTWPAHPKSAQIVPVVAFGDDPDAALERVGLVARAGDDATIEWARMSPAGRDERFELDIVIRTSVPGVKDSLDVVDRLEQLADLVQDLWYDPDSGEFHPPGGEDWQVLVGGVARVVPVLAPTDEGWIGMCTVTAVAVARI